MVSKKRMIEIIKREYLQKYNLAVQLPDDPEIQYGCLVLEQVLLYTGVFDEDTLWDFGQETRDKYKA